MALKAPAPLTTRGGDIFRACGTCTLAIHATIGSADVLLMGGWAGGAILVPASVTNLTFHGSIDGTNFAALYDSDNGAVTSAVTQGTWYTFPDSVFAHAYIKIVSAGANGTATVVCKS